MAYSSAAVSASELAARAADCPLLIGNNVLETYTIAPEWRVSGSWASGSDISDEVDYNIARVVDRHGHAVTKPTAADVTGETEVSLIFRITPSTSRYADSIVIWGHNFQNLGANVEVTFTIADTNTFSGGSAVTLWTWNSFSTNRRLVGLGTTRYANLEYCRLRIRKTSGTFGALPPAVGEIIFGRSRQMPYRPNSGWDPRATEAEVRDFVADSGRIVRHKQASGRLSLDMAYNPAASNSYGFDQAADLRALWEEAEHGSRPVVVITNPTTEPTVAPVMRVMADQLDMPRTGPFVRAFRLPFLEVAPFAIQEIETATVTDGYSALFIPDGTAHPLYGWTEAYVVYSPDDLDDETKLTVDCYFQAPSGLTVPTILIQSRGAPEDVGRRHFSVEITDTGEVKLTANATAGAVDAITATSVVSFDTPHHLMTVFDFTLSGSAKIKVYLDGSLVSWSSFSDSTPSTKFENYSSQSRYFFGWRNFAGDSVADGLLIDYVRAWTGVAATSGQASEYGGATRADDDSGSLGTPTHLWDFAQDLEDTGSSPFTIYYDQNITYSNDAIHPTF